MRITNDTIFNMATNLISIDTVLGKHKTQAHVALVINRGKVLAVASNSVGSRSRGSGYGMCTIHAERAALKKVGDTSKLNGATLIVIRIMKGTRQLGNSEPCHSCRCHLEKCMRQHGLKQVYYSA
jgi:hypothetical protein